MGLATSYQNFKIFSKISLAGIFGLFILDALMTIYTHFRKMKFDPDKKATELNDFKVSPSLLCTPILRTNPWHK